MGVAKLLGHPVLSAGAAQSSADANAIVPDLNLKDSSDQTPLALALDMNMNEVRTGTQGRRGDG